MIDHEKWIVSGDDYERLLALLYPGQTDEFGHVNMWRLGGDCITLGVEEITVRHFWSDRRMVYFLARQAGLLDLPPIDIALGIELPAY